MTNQDLGTPYLPAHIANYFLWQADQEKIPLTTMKLVKLVYFGYAWCYAAYGKKLFSEKIEAWRHGPVVPSIYHEFKRFGSDPISRFSVQFDSEINKILFPVISESDEMTIPVLDAVWKVYKNKSGLELSEITHEENSPWKYAYEQGENTVLDDQKIIIRAKEAILKYQEEIVN